MTSRRPAADGGWFWLDNSMVENHLQKIGSAAFAAYAILASHADEAGFCFPKIGRFQKLMRVSKRTVEKALRVLAEEGLITIQPRFDERGAQISNGYILPPRQKSTGGPRHRSTGPQCQSDTPPASKEHHQEQDPMNKTQRTTGPAHSGPDEASLKAGRKESAKPAFTLEDLNVANWMWSLIVAMQPSRKPPKLDAWANTIRLMREQDQRTHEQIRDLFQRVQRDEFWRKNILSPEKLRAKWDDLTLKLIPDAAKPAERPASILPARSHPSPQN